MIIYCLIGYQREDNDAYTSALYGTFSTQDKAKECGDELARRKAFSYYEIITSVLDDFGYK